jgi:amino acid adenylation domain-containing protein
MSESRTPDPRLVERLSKMSPAKRALFLRQAGLPPEYAAPRDDAAPNADTIPRHTGDAAPLSFAQELLYMLQAATPGLATYNSPRAYRITGTLNIGALQQALDAHVARHEVYRNVIQAEGGQFVQRVQPARPIAIHTEDLREQLGAVGAEQRESVLAARVQRVMRESFDLERDQLLRATLLRTGENEQVLVLVSHHIASDGWSRGIMFREIAAAYAAALESRTAELPALPMQYSDYAAWQREYLSGERLAKLLAFWRGELEGAPALLELPTDRPRSVVQQEEGGRVDRLASAALTARLKSLAREHDATLFMTLLAAWQVLLSRWSGQEDVLVGTPVAGRSRPEVQGLVGYFADTVVIRGALGSKPSFSDYLRAVRDRVMRAFEHQEVPYEKLVVEMANERGGSTAPLYQALFVMHDDQPARLALAGAEVTPLAVHGGWTKSDVSIAISDTPSGLRLVLEYRSALFDRERMERMLASYETLLEAVVASPATSIKTLRILPAGDERRLGEWNATHHERDVNATLIQRIEQTVDRAPDDAALVLHTGETLSFRELERRANQLARVLQRHGVGPGAGVALCFDRSFELVIGMLAAMKAGGHYVPLDPSYPADRIAYMLEDSGAPVTLTSTAFRSALPDDLGRSVLVLLDRDADAIARENDARIASPAGPEDLAYMIYTSGSTGRPKGVMIPHRAVVNYVEWMRTLLPLDNSDGILQKAPASFDASIWEFFLPLVTGSRLVLAKPGGQQDPDYLVSTIRDHDVTVMQLVPSQLQMVLDARNGAALGELRLLVLGGEALPGDLLARLDRSTSVPIVNLYGPTECTVYAMVWSHDPRRDGQWDGSAVPIGTPVHNTQIHIVAPDTLERQPLGVAGELLIGGVQVARGYQARPELTAEKFVSDALSTTPGAMLYRTGDLARWRSDGIVEYLGRVDNQVKLRGFRIELGEIEEALLRHPAVRQCVVLVREDAGSDKRLVGYVSFEPGTDASAAELRDFLRGGLPDYMVPTAFVVLDSIPLNANGKADRKTLMARPLEGVATVEAPSDVPYAAPRTTIEHELLAIWESLLPRRPIGIRDDFFEIGGHSLLAMRMLLEIERVRGRRLPVATLFEHTTIESLAQVITAEVERDSDQALVVLNGDAPGTPVVFAHGDVRGGGWYSRRLAGYIADRPLIVLPTIRPGEGAVPRTVEAIAAWQIDALQKVRGTGPYVVAGFCTGGLIAYEIAQQLRARGEQVEQLVVIDTAAHNAGFGPLEPVLSLLAMAAPSAGRLDRRAAFIRSARYYRARLREVAGRSARERVEWLVRNVKRRLGAPRKAEPPNATNGKDTLAVAARKANTWIDEDEQLMGAGASGPGLQTLLFQQRAAVSYIQRKYPGILHAIMARPAGRTLNPKRDTSRGWRRLARVVDVSEVEATHVGLITRDLPALGEALAAVLRRSVRS